MNINTLSEHRCADKCTDFKATGEQCNHCLVSCPEISDNSSYSEIPNSLNFKLSELKQIIAEMTAANDRLILKYMGEKRQDLAAIHGSFNVALAGLIFQLELPQGNTKKHTQLAETELYRQKQKVELLKTEKLATQVELDADRDDLNPSNSTPLNFEEYENRCGYHNLLSRVQGISESAYSISYSHLTKSTEEQIQFFNKQKKIAEDGGDQQEAISFDHQADGAYLLWLRLTKGCRNPSDNERFQVLVGAKA